VVEEKGRQAAREKEARKPWPLKEISGKTLWDWLQLLVVPIMLLIITLTFSFQQNARQNAIEEQRAQVDREIEEQRSQSAALQAYLDQMTQLMLERNLREADQDSEVRTMARVRTLTVLASLDPARRKEVLRFLYEAQLLDRSGPVVELSGADLQSVDLSGTNLSGGAFVVDTSDAAQQGVINMDVQAGDYDDSIDLSGADLSSADLSQSVLMAANLSDADLSNANLTRAVMTPGLRTIADMPSDYEAQDSFLANIPEGFVTDLRAADLSSATLRDAWLGGANLSYTNLANADLYSSWLPGASLVEANLTNAKLISVNLSGADLTGANLSGADLTYAPLTKEQLEQIKSLEGATMPDGQKYEDWLKSKGSGGMGRTTAPRNGSRYLRQ
jgi:uncharacterized protein YjbI with pentapeptide repeats